MHREETHKVPKDGHDDSYFSSLGLPFLSDKAVDFLSESLSCHIYQKNKRPQMLQGGRCYHFPVFMDPVVLTGSCSIS